MNVNFIGALLVLVVFSSTGCQESAKRRIEVSGSADVYAAPELARFDFAIEERGKILSTAKRSVDERTAKLVKLCKAQGIDPKDITSAEITIEPQYNYNNNVFIGYQVSRSVHANLYDLDKYSNVIEGAVNAGITTIQNISLELKQENTMEYQALERAIAKAREKAELLAEKSGVKLGKVLRVSESQSRAYQDKYEFKGMLERAAAPNGDVAVFEPGQLTVSRTVHVIFDIDD